MTSVPQALMTNLLSVLIFLPLAGVLLLVFLPRENHRLLRNATFAVTLAEFLLSTFLMPITILSTYTSVEKHVKEFMIFMLILEVGMVGVFLAIDLFLFYVFWETVLIPMYFLIGVWGSDRRIYSAIKFFLYTFAGSVLMLVAIIALYFHHYEVTGVYSTDLLAMYALAIPVKLQFWMFAAFALAFAFKVPMFPFHTWLPH